MDERTLLAVLAHPDDESFAIGGTLARYAASGVQVALLIATRGEAARSGGDPTRVAAVREQELRHAVRVLGVNILRILGYQDGRLAGTDRPMLVSRLVATLREVRPHVVITFGPDGISGHPDHVRIGEAAAEAFGLAGQADYSTGPTSADSRPHHPLRLFHIAPSPATRQCCRKGIGEFTTLGLTVVDVAAFREVKVRAMQCHASQEQPFPGDPGAEAGRLHEREYFRLIWPTGATPPATDLLEGLP